MQPRFLEIRKVFFKCPWAFSLSSITSWIPSAFKPFARVKYFWAPVEIMRMRPGKSGNSRLSLQYGPCFWIGVSLGGDRSGRIFHNETLVLGLLPDFAQVIQIMPKT